MSLPSDNNLEPNPLIFGIDNFVSNEIFLLLDLVCAVLVESEETRKELHCVLEILLHLVNSSVSYKSLLLGEPSDGRGPLGRSL